MGMNEWVLMALVMMAESCLHYFPWRMLLRGRELPRLAAYTLGLLGMMVPLTVWLLEKGAMEIIQVLWSVVIVAGMTVFALYGLDHYLSLIMRDIEATEWEQQNAKK